MNATQRILAAKGVSSFAELAGKDERNESAPAKTSLYPEFDSLCTQADAIESALRAAGVTVEDHRRPDESDLQRDEIQACIVMEARIAVLRTTASLNSVKLSVPAQSSSASKAGRTISCPASASNPTSSAATKKPNATARILAAKGLTSIDQLGATSVVDTKAKPGSATEKVLQAKGCSTLEELPKKRGKVSAIIAALFLSFMFTVPAKAQQSGVYTLITDSTNTIAAATTNQPVYFNVSEYPDFMLMIRARGHSGTASNIQAYLYRSLDTTDYESEPWKILQLQLSGTATNLINTNLDVGGVAALKMVLANTNAVVITNLNAKARYKATKIRN
jgi:hypothetical protein